MLENNKEPSNCQNKNKNRRKPCTAEEHVYLSVHGFSFQHKMVNMVEMLEVVGGVVPLVPNPGVGREMGI